MKLPDNLASLPLEELIKLWKQFYITTDDLADDPVPRCGWYCLSTTAIYRLFGSEDPFLKCCVVHDIEYALKRKARSQVDRELYICMKEIAGGNVALKIAAFVYYGIVKVSGGIFW